jgi:hypothetical protein
VGAAGEGDVGVLAVLSAGDDGQAGVHGAALGDMVGDRVAQFGFFAVCVQELAVRPAAPPCPRVGVQGAADQQPAFGDGLDAEQVPVGQHPAGFPGLGAVVVAGAGDQVPAAGAVYCGLVLMPTADIASPILAPSKTPLPAPVYAQFPAARRRVCRAGS